MTYHVVIVGGGFAGLYAAKALRREPVKVTLIDKRNFHLFQPLLYQVATGELSPADIASPLRSVLKHAENVRVVAGEVVDIDAKQRQVFLRDEVIPYDSLIVATGAQHHYFGNDEEWGGLAPGLKTAEDASEIRRRVYLAYETAERETSAAARRPWLTFVIVGAGPTGVELAGALSELAHNALRGEFRSFDPAETEIILVEGLDRVLNSFPEALSSDAQQALEKLGVTVRLGSMVTEIANDHVIVRDDESGETERIDTHTVLWAAGVKASPLGEVVANATEAKTDRMGRVIVEPDMSVAGYPDLFVVGDLAHFAHTPDGQPLPGVAQVAMQQGDYVARLLKKRREGKLLEPFVYSDKGNMAVIGRNLAVADIGRYESVGFLAWLVWAFIHIAFLVEFDNRLKVMLQWAWTYFTGKRGSRLIMGAPFYPLLETSTSAEAESEELYIPENERIAATMVEPVRER